MARTKIKLTGNPETDLKMLFEECSNNNQICFFIKKNQSIIDYLKKETGLNRDPMVLLYHFKERTKEVPKCICGKERKYKCYGYRETCGDRQCSSQVREESKRDFCLKNYGVEYVTQLESMKEKSKKTCLDRFGVDNSTKSPEIIKKRKENNLVKYGVTDPIALREVRGKTITDSERGKIKVQSGLPEGYKVIEIEKNTYKMECPKGHIFDVSKYTLSNRKNDNTEICNLCNEYIGSLGEQELFDYVSSVYDGHISRSNRKLISPFEIDIVLEDLKLCIEFNGDYWHSTKIKDEFYHLNKLNMCLSKGYKLIQVRENEWNKDKETIKRKIYNLINGILDLVDFDIDGNRLRLDLSWYDDRLVKDMESVETHMPVVVNSGQYESWNCGYHIFQIIK